MPTSIITRGSGVSVAGRQSRGLSPAFSRASAAYQSDGRKVGVGVPRFSEGRTGKAIFVEEGTTNLCQNGGAELGATWWGAYNNGWSVEAEAVRWGNKAFRCNKGYYGGLQSPKVAFDCTKAISVSFDLCRIVGEAWWHILFYNNEGVQVGQRGNRQIPTGLHGAWEHMVIALLPSDIAETATQTVVRLLRRGVETTIDDVVYDNILCEQKPYATSFTDSTRAADRLTIPTTITSAGSWAIEAWARTNITAGFERTLFEAAGVFAVGLGADNKPTLTWTSAEGPQTVSGAQTVTNPTGDHHWAYTYDGAIARVYVDGATVIEAATEFAGAMPAEIVIGTAEGRYWNGYIEDLVIAKHAYSGSDIASHMAGDTPSDCYYYPFDGNLWPAPGSLGAVVAPSIITRPGKLEVIGR